MKRSKAIISCITLACSFILCSSADAFENDPQVLGEWESVDFVTDISDFKPDAKSWKGDLYLEEFEFKKKGSTQNDAFTWTKGKVHYTEFDMDGKYIIKKVDGKDYLFLEWINGDVKAGNEKPRYYVFERD